MESNTLREVAVQVCHYFKDFLESDFKRQQAPRRRVVLQSESGFRTGMRVRLYPSMEADLWSLLGKPSAEPLQLKITPRKYTRSLSPVLRRIVEEHIAAIEPQALESARRGALEHIARGYAASIEDPEQWIEKACATVREQVGQFLVRPLVTRLDAALQRQAYNVMDSLFTAENEMIQAVTGEALAQLPAVLAKHLARRDDAAVEGALAAFLTEEGAKAALSSFFEAFVTADAFLEFRDLDTYATITEGVQMYLYIGSCKFRNAQYPLFFAPVEVEKLPDGQGYRMTVVNQLFANRAAIDFVLQETAQAKMREWASPIQERINYLSPEQSLYEVARNLFGLVTNAMDLAGQIELSSRSSDASTADVTLSTALHLCVFDRGEEALVNDYEELITLARTGGGAIVDLFEKMVRGVLQENPRSITAEIEAQWEAMPLTERLVFDSPIPLNEEQRKILLAVRKQDGWIVVVEGPPGTGKSHTITAIAADCAFNQKSCLVLSDKAEALEVVQDKLSQAMSRVRHVDDFPNPLLRIGRQDANFKKLVANQTVNQVANYVRAVRANQSALDAASVLRSKLDDAKVERLFPHAYRLVSRGVLGVDGPRAARQALDVLVRIPGALEGLLRAPATDWVIALGYLRDWLELCDAFRRAPEFDYVGCKTKLEHLNTSTMNSHVDSRLVQFMENHRADARTLAQLISQRQKFPEDKFGAVRSSFPIIIASIREFGEYMPLAPELFDVVVIDEASQVSVAQALPALLRAKKVVVLGDSKQFSNVKSSQASIAINEKYRSNLVQFFEKNVSRDAQTLQRLAMFDVKRSILEFCSMAASYSIMLRKHFRSYPELISYSSATFYNHQLQAIKVRGLPLDEVIRFDQVDPSGKSVSRASNHAEADFIEAKLLELLEESEPPSVGVITPFREQHTLLTKRLHGHPRAEEFEKKLRLKVMTFDTCQGEERQIVFYSMVATPGNDALNYVFPVSIDGAEDSVEDKLKMQRLNVGFSRAQEMIWIVHSMPLESFRGSIAGAMHHYTSVLRRKLGEADQVDPSSPMEQRVLSWLQQTPFVQENGDDVEILPQFPIGEYLKQLDPTYDHPSWRVDFLLTYQGGGRPVYVVVEYDGFEFHFKPDAQVHVGNHQRYLRSEDVERQLTLESYGYRFLRVNRFNMGKDPVATLDERIRKLVEMATGDQMIRTVEQVRTQAEGMSNGQMRQCRTCTTVLPLESFFDQALKNGAGGYGFKCMGCKDSARRPPLRSVSSGRPRQRRWRRWG